MARHPRVLLVSEDENVASGCLLLRLTPDADPERVFVELQELDGVQQLDAIRGDWTLLAPVHAASDEALTEVAERAGALAGVAETKLRRLALAGPRVEDVEDEDEPAGPGPATLYASVETEPERLDAIFAAMGALTEVRDLAVDRDEPRIVARVQAADFDAIRTVLNQRVRYMDGVLRVNEMMVVGM